MRFLIAAGTALFLTFSTHGNVVDADSFSKRFKKGSHNFGAQIGWAYTFDLPPGRDRINIGMLFVFPNWQSNITGLVGESWYRGALFHHVEAGFANAVDRGGNWLWACVGAVLSWVWPHVRPQPPGHDPPTSSGSPASDSLPALRE